MPYFTTSQEWLQQSALLLEARPSTTRVSTRYSIKPARARKSSSSSSGPATAAASDKPPRGRLVLKTFDPISGATLKYKTAKAAEVTRLVGALRTLGRRQAALPAEVAMEDAPAPAETEQVPASAAGAQAQAQGGQQQPPQQGAGGGGKGKKKKGKR